MPIRHTGLFALALTLFFTNNLPAAGLPNIVVILADDLGYGDVQALNPDSSIETPHLDRLAREGVTFLDAHSPSAVCTPTRYGLLTGRYCWRSPLKSGVLGGYSPPLVERDRPTVATVLKTRGYRTAAIGKWHLGMQLPFRDEAAADRSPWEGDPGIDFEGQIVDSPIHHGFDYFFGVSASLDMAPYVYVRDDHFTAVPSIQQPAVKFPHFVRSGPRAADFVIDDVLDRLTSEASQFIAQASHGDHQPFFLYWALTAPHKPAQPHERFRGKTGLGEYADFVTQVDASIGRVLETLDEHDVARNTVVFFSSDNGSYMFRRDSSQTDHLDDASIQGYRPEHHRPNGIFRGTKADIYEAGHHVPLLVRWPGVSPPSSMCQATVCLTDLFATCAEIAVAPVEPGVAEDSCSLLAMIKGQDIPRPRPVIHHSVNGMFAIRSKQWKLILGNGSGGREQPRGRPFAEPYQLYDMSVDPTETENVASRHPDVVRQLTDAFTSIRN